VRGDRRRGDLVADDTGKPGARIDGLGATAPARWKAGLDQHRAQRVWDASSRSFVAR
jgi:hypothetical protein